MRQDVRALYRAGIHAPATATNIATKPARHFAGDEPPPAMSARLADSFTRSKGDLPTVYRTLIAVPEAWGPKPTKFKTPWEWTLPKRICTTGFGRQLLHASRRR